MAIIECSDGVLDVTWEVAKDLDYGWCPFCGPVDSNIKRLLHSGWYCSNCDTKFRYTGKQNS